MRKESKYEFFGCFLETLYGGKLERKFISFLTEERGPAMMGHTHFDGRIGIYT